MIIAVYCGSGFGNRPVFEEAARELGEWIGKSGHSLVYGGGADGLMGAVAQSAVSAGAEVTGVVPGNVDFIASRPQPFCSRVIRTENMSSRKEKMLELSDAFVALPGGIGTLDEISEAITLTKIGVFSKKCVLFNKDGFYEPLKQMVDCMISSGFLTAKDMEKVCFASTVQEIEAFLNS